MIGEDDSKTYISNGKLKEISEDDGGTIAGYKTEKFTVLANGESHETLWLATDASLIKEFKSLVGMLSEVVLKSYFNHKKGDHNSL
jgi:hypothetical protein